MACQGRRSRIFTLDVSFVFCYKFSQIQYNSFVAESTTSPQVVLSFVLQGILSERNNTMSKYTTFDERMEIENMLAKNFSFGEMARWLNKNRSTISREIKNHSLDEKTGYSSISFNACKYRYRCKLLQRILLG